MITALAIIVLVLQIVGLVVIPSMFGEERGKYDYNYFIGQIITTLIVGAICLRAIGLI